MKNINSPSRVIALLGLSACVHGAVLWAVTEKVSITALPEAPALMWSESESTGTEAALQTTPNPVEIQIEEKKVEEKVELKTVEPKKLVEKPVKKAIKKSVVATELPAKEVKTTTKTLNIADDLPKTTVAEASEPENLDPEIQSEENGEPQVNLIPVKEGFAGVAAQEEPKHETEAGTEGQLSSNLGAEIAQAEQAMAAMGAGELSSKNVRSYQSLKQVAGNKPPQYPMQARRLGHQGRVDLKYFVTENGTVKDVNVENSSGSELLDKEAIRAVSDYKFYPGQAGWTKHPVKFSLRGPQETIPAQLRTSGSSYKEN